MKKLFSILAAKLGEESAFNLTKKREKRTHKNKNRRRKTTFKTEKRRQIKFKQIGGGRKYTRRTPHECGIFM